MWRQRAISCFKIMIQISIMDMVNLSLNAVLTGYFTFTGAVYCSAPLTSYICGALVLGFWCNCCASSILLALHRCLDLWFPGRMYSLFGGYRTLCWLTLPYLYGFYFTWYTPAPSYSSKGYAWFFDPYVGITSIHIHKNMYMNSSHAVHNVATPAVIAVFYALILLTLWYKTRRSSTHTVNMIQKKLTLQSCIICSFNFSACSLYVYIQYRTEPPSIWLVVLTQVLWISCNWRLQGHLSSLYKKSLWENRYISDCCSSANPKKRTTVTGFLGGTKIESSPLCYRHQPMKLQR
uniref:7TM_GPCR_Srx domain-containing protein n=2 Tax=Steinernema glaseri TaxID=37863 RepID=A0A1I7YCE8_9BILA